MAATQPLGALSLVINDEIDVLRDPTASLDSGVALYHRPNDSAPRVVSKIAFNQFVALTSLKSAVVGINDIYCNRLPRKRVEPTGMIDEVLREFAMKNMASVRQRINEIKQSLGKEDQVVVDDLLSFRYHINLLLNSPGGSTVSCGGLVGLLMQVRKRRAHVTAFGSTYIASAASILFMSADQTRREMLVDADFSFHLNSRLCDGRPLDVGDSKEKRAEERLAALRKLGDFLIKSTKRSKYVKPVVRMKIGGSEPLVRSDETHDGLFSINPVLAREVFKVRLHENPLSLRDSYRAALAEQIGVPVGKVELTGMHPAIDKFFLCAVK